MCECAIKHWPTVDQWGDWRERIDESSFVIVWVGIQGQVPLWTHTAGLSDWNLPELVVSGLSADGAAELLYELGERLIEDGKAFRAGQRVRLDNGRLVEMVEVSEPYAVLSGVADALLPGLQALQAVHTDDRGHWPWDHRYQNHLGWQPLLGQRALKPAQPASV